MKANKSTNVLLAIAVMICSFISAADAIRVDSFPTIFQQEQIDSSNTELSTSIHYHTARYLLGKPFREEPFVFFANKNEVLLSQVLNQIDFDENSLHHFLVVNNHTFQINYPLEDPIS